MEKITFENHDKKYDILSIDQVSGAVLRVVFPAEGERPTADLLTQNAIKVLTQGEVHVSTLTGFSTVYREEENAIYLSNDESVYTPPTEPGDGGEYVPPEPYIPTPEELLASAIRAKKSEVNAACEKAIISGIDVTLSDGTEKHFNLEIEDQLALLLCASAVQNGQENIPWHSNAVDSDTTQPCEFYSNADMQTITAAAQAHITYHQTYCNSLKIWIESCTEPDAVNAIYYGSEIPVEYQSDVMKAD